MKNIVFQGDSITDTLRDRNSETDMGLGFAAMLAKKIAEDYPGQYTCYNRGCGGDKSINVYARIKRDAINLNPSILTLMVGVNDVWHELLDRDGIDTPKYERIMEAFITEVKEALPDVTIILIESYILNGNNIDRFRDELYNGVREKMAVVKKLAEKYSLDFVPLQEMMSEKEAQLGREAVTIDGVHPTDVGHTFICDAVYKTLKKYL